jgi:hypothetical protein
LASKRGTKTIAGGPRRIDCGGLRKGAVNAIRTGLPARQPEPLISQQPGSEGGLLASPRRSLIYTRRICALQGAYIRRLEPGKFAELCSHCRRKPLVPGRFARSRAERVAGNRVLEAVGARGANAAHEINSSAAYGFVFDFCGIKVDCDTGVIRIDKYVSLHDAGRILNPALFDGQVRGGFAMAIGAALDERFVYAEDGGFLTDSPKGTPHYPEQSCSAKATPRRNKKKRKSDLYRNSPTSRQTPATASRAALAISPLSLAIVINRKPMRIMRAA